MNTVSNKKKVPAYIDEKNVTTDWIEEVFDDHQCVCGGNCGCTFVGFVNSCVVLANVSRNHIGWQIVQGQYTESEVKETYDILIERLKELDDPDNDNIGIYCEYYELLKHDGFVEQSFYFKEEVK